VQTFSTMTQDLLPLLDWLHAAAVRTSRWKVTGSYWRPVYKSLGGAVNDLVAMPPHEDGARRKTT